MRSSIITAGCFAAALACAAAGIRSQQPPSPSTPNLVAEGSAIVIERASKPQSYQQQLDCAADPSCNQ